MQKLSSESLKYVYAGANCYCDVCEPEDARSLGACGFWCCDKNGGNFYVYPYCKDSQKLHVGLRNATIAVDSPMFHLNKRHDCLKKNSLKGGSKNIVLLNSV